MPDRKPGTVGWRKSSFSVGNTDCVELAEIGDEIAVRDSKNPDGGSLVLTRNEMQAFILGVKATSSIT